MNIIISDSNNGPKNDTNYVNNEVINNISDISR